MNLIQLYSKLPPIGVPTNNRSASDLLAGLAKTENLKRELTKTPLSTTESLTSRYLDQMLKSPTTVDEQLIHSWIANTFHSMDREWDKKLLQIDKIRKLMDFKQAFAFLAAGYRLSILSGNTQAEPAFKKFLEVLIKECPNDYQSLNLNNFDVISEPFHFDLSIASPQLLLKLNDYALLEKQTGMNKIKLAACGLLGLSSISAGAIAAYIGFVPETVIIEIPPAPTVNNTISDTPFVTEVQNSVPLQTPPLEPAMPALPCVPMPEIKMPIFPDVPNDPPPSAFNQDTPVPSVLQSYDQEFSDITKIALITIGTGTLVFLIANRIRAYLAKRAEKANKPEMPVAKNEQPENTPKKREEADKREMSVTKNEQSKGRTLESEKTVKAKAQLAELSVKLSKFEKYRNFSALNTQIKDIFKYLDSEPLNESLKKFKNKTDLTDEEIREIQFLSHVISNHLNKCENHITTFDALKQTLTEKVIKLRQLKVPAHKEMGITFSLIEAIIKETQDLKILESPTAVLEKILQISNLLLNTDFNNLEKDLGLDLQKKLLVLKKRVEKLTQKNLTKFNFPIQLNKQDTEDDSKSVKEEGDEEEEKDPVKNSIAKLNRLFEWLSKTTKKKDVLVSSKTFESFLNFISELPMIRNQFANLSNKKPEENLFNQLKQLIEEKLEAVQASRRMLNYYCGGPVDLLEFLVSESGPLAQFECYLNLKE